MSAATVTSTTSPRSRGRIAWRILATPLALAVVVGILAVYLGSQDLDSIERQSLDLAVIRRALIVHVELTAISTALVIAIAVPLGIALTRPAARRIAPLALGVANIGQAVPSIGVLALFAIVVGLGWSGVIFALVLYSMLSVLRNTIVGLEGIDPAIVEAARGMGMSKLRTLRRIELPLALPVMLAGIRTALILNVGTVTLASFTLGAPPDGSGGLGEIINSGLRLGRLDTVVLAGAVLTAVLALLVDCWQGWSRMCCDREEFENNIGRQERMSGIAKKSLVTALLVLAVVVVAGCGGGDSGGGEKAEGGSASEVDLSGSSFTVGSKEFTEQLILGQITIGALQAAGAETKDQTGLEGSVAARSALTSGDIDMYWEYTGTAWVDYLKNEEGIPDEKGQYEAVKKADAAKGVSWTDLAPANDTYAFAVRSETGTALDKVESISELAELAKSEPDLATLCVGEGVRQPTRRPAGGRKDLRLRISPRSGLPGRRLGRLRPGWQGRPLRHRLGVQHRRPDPVGEPCAFSKTTRNSSRSSTWRSPCASRCLKSTRS